MSDLYGSDDEDAEAVPARRRRLAERAAAGMEPGFEEPEGVLESIENLEDMKGMSVVEWVQQPATRQEIKNRFKAFLRTFLDANDRSVYAERIIQMARDNKQSLHIDYQHLATAEQVLAFFLPEAPQHMLDIFDEVFCPFLPSFLGLTYGFSLLGCARCHFEPLSALRQNHQSSSCAYQRPPVD